MKRTAFMGTSPKHTDNRSLPAKLALRRYFLDRYHQGGRPPLVFDACQGEGMIWKRLRTEYAVRYWGVDFKRRRGRVKVDSARVLALPGWEFDIIDVDTYGSPWEHWEQILKNMHRPVTVFMTLGNAYGGGAVTEAALRTIGLGRLAPRLNRMPGLRRKIHDYAITACLGAAGDRVLEAARTLPWVMSGGRRAEYIGVRLGSAAALR